MSEQARGDGLLLALLAAAGALWIRIAIPFRRVFHDGWVDFQGDAWYHVRAIEHLVVNFPHRLTSDPYAGPDAPYVAVAPLFDYIIASMALVTGAGHPSPILLERIAAFAPPLLGAMAVVLVYTLGARIFDRTTGILASGLLAVIPGPFLDRTLLGATDHHALEMVLVLTVMWCAVAVCQAGEARASARLRYASAGGIGLGAYYLTWTSAPLFAFGLALWASIQFLLDRIRGRSSAYLWSLLLCLSATALVMVAVFQNPAIFRYQLQLESLAGLLALGLSLAGAERLRLSPAAMAAAAAGLAAAAAAGLAFGVWHVPAGLLQDLARFEPGALGRTVAEMEPLLSPGGTVSLAQPWQVFRTGFYIAVPALAALAVNVIARRDSGARSLLVVWGTVTLAATLGQVRFAYYLSPIVALLTAWTCSSCVAWIATHSRRPLLPHVAIVIAAAAVLYPTLRLSLAGAGLDDGMPERWKRSLDWLRMDTPDPFGNPDTYWQRYDRAPMPRPSYTVMSWWDYGYWITRAGRRVPIANPTQSGAVQAADFFTATSEDEAVRLMTISHARYAIVDSELSFGTIEGGRGIRGMFNSVVQWAGRRESVFYETLTTRGADGRLSPVIVFYPDYYRAMAVRLTRFPSTGVVPDGGTWVVSIEERTDAGGTTRREIVQSRRFASYDAAEAFRARLGAGEHRIAGLDPERTCVPLPPLADLQIVHEESSDSGRVRILARRGID